MMENKIEVYETATALIVEDAYNLGQQRRIYLEIDWDAQEITAWVDYNSGSVAARVWHGLSSLYRLNNQVDAPQLREWVQAEIVPRAEAMVSQFESVWDGHNRVGRWTTDEDGIPVSIGAIEEIDLLCGEDVPTLQGDAPGLWDVRKWANVTNAELNADTTDDQIAALVRDIESAADSDNVVLTGPDLTEWLTEKRDELREG